VKQRSRKRPGKRPVLTSPWKIGAFVALQLVFVGISVGYFFVAVYDVRLQWLKVGAGAWGIDSYLFFRQMYPLVAAVTIISLMSYFIVSSAVRRYKFYLDSGQDYRKMIALAESIDDLTNPAQIARLSSYPELQAILRNYGDSIREISQELGQREEKITHADLEREIEALLGEEASQEGSGGEGWESTCRKVAERLESDRTRIEELAARTDAYRAVIGGATLAYGRIMEAISGAGEDLLEITERVNELHGAAVEAGAAPAPTDKAGAQRKTLKAIVVEMENAVRKLEEGGHVLHEFSEENNGVALNMALMAAKGSVSEHDLASLAEKVRGTAERFRRLNGTIVSIAQGLLANCYALKEKLGETAPPSREASPHVQRKILETARVIEERSNLLQKRICNLGSELHEVRELLQKDFTVSGAAPDGKPSREDPMRFAATAPAGESRDLKEESSFIIDHGKSWAGIGAGDPAPAAPAPREEAEPSEAPEAAVEETEEPAASEEPAEEEAIDFSDISSLRDLERPEEPAPAAEAPRDAAQHDGSWMEMPGHRWLKINVEKPESGPDAVSVNVQGAPEPAAASVEAEPAPAAEAANEMPPADEGERVYDLLELGAVEYAGETQAQR
jgi:hypothetical protein